MSTILLTQHDENVYKIIKKEAAKPPSKISAKSPFIANLLEAEEKKNKFCHKTFGYAEIPLKKPSEYLKKHSRILPPCPKIDEPRCLLPERRPPVPSQRSPAKKQQESENCVCHADTIKQDEEVKKCTTHRNFCHKNIIQAVRLAPRQPQRNYVDTKKGDAHPLEPSGLEPHYILKKSFGKSPNYLRLRQLEEDSENKQKEAEINRFKPEGRYITEKERLALLEGLKHNWVEVQKAYQQLPILTDTIPKKKHKTRLENELKQLENDIKTLERHPHIYVTDADCSEFNYDPDSD
ncbi:hypothetical protein L9F63_007386 [Diploptera punctata]|uniref:Enkurin domain-containing protein n=1 Tax=Diploptera punctata TaxID=6984 RepID=A0AAD8E3C0_DIPPU|nr:hypothetical protein L9F63_007386 [Diploptera punctata]